VTQEEMAARASSGLASFFPARRLQAGITLQLALELSLLRMNRCRRARSAVSFNPESGMRSWMQ
jgi:hypothetical protein